MIVLLLAACFRDTPPLEASVLVLVMDGVRLQDSLGTEGDSFDGRPTADLLPRIWSEWVPRGALSQDAWNTGATLTVPAHVNLGTGRGQAFANYPNPAGPGVYRPDLPSWWEDPEGDDAVISNATLLEPIGGSAWPGSTRDASWTFVGEDGVPSYDDADVGQAIQDHLATSPTRSLVANFHQVDRSAHDGDAARYPHDVERLDGIVSDLVARLTPTSWVLLLADHGRHNTGDDDPVWRSHGCACSGCRRIPFLLLGPGVRPGDAGQGPITLSDVAPTVGALLGIPTPWADGFVLESLFESPLDGTVRDGAARLALTASHQARVEYLPDPAHRTRLLLDDQPVSSPGVLEVDAPALAQDGDRAWACWRELSLDTDPSPWVPRCLQTEDGVTWEAVDPPLTDVGPFWEPALVPVPGGKLAMVYSHNPSGILNEADTEAEGEVGLHVDLLDRGAWSPSESTTAPTFPLEATAVTDGRGLVLAVAGSAGTDRMDRDIYLYRHEGGAWTEAGPTGLLPGLFPDAGAWRLEHPVLYLSPEGDLALAAVGTWGGGGSGAVLARSADGGLTWAEPSLLQGPGPVLPHLGPAVVQGSPIFGFLDSDQVSLCGPGDCVQTGSPRVLRLASDGTRLQALVDRGVGSWQVEEW